MSEHHAHMCGLSNETRIFDPAEGCGHVFVHDGEATQELHGEDYAKVHACPECGKGDWRMRLPPGFTYEERAEAENAVNAFASYLAAKDKLRGKHGSDLFGLLAMLVPEKDRKRAQFLVRQYPNPMAAPRETIEEVLRLLRAPERFTTRALEEWDREHEVMTV